MKTDMAGFRAEWKTDIASRRGEIADMKAVLSEQPGKACMWGSLTALLTACACGLAALAILK
jgi:hypothetical protein